MNKSYTMLVLALSLILVQMSFAKPSVDTPTYSDSKADDKPNEDSSDEADSEDEDDDEEENPDMSCLLFGKEGCHAGCVITGSLFQFRSHGFCDSNQVCNCHSYSDESFHDIWKKTFNSDYVYRKVRDNELVADQVSRIFYKSFQSNEEVKEALGPILSPYQFSRLKTNDKHRSVKYTKDGKFDEAILKKYVKEKLDKRLGPKLGKSLLNSKYKEKFREALENAKESKASLYNFTYRVNQLKNKNLENVLEEYLKKAKIEKPKTDIAVKNDGLDTIVESLVINELIDRIEEKNKGSEKSSKAGKKSPATRTASKRVGSAAKKSS